MTKLDHTPWIITLSPAKKIQDCSSPLSEQVKALVKSPAFIDKTFALVKRLKAIDTHGLEQLMSISTKLAVTNQERYQNFPSQNAAFEHLQPAVFQFIGDVYKIMRIDDFDAKSLERTHDSLFILSGLYGLLSAFDGMYPYRLEMGCACTKLWGFSLYEFWQQALTEHLNQLLSSPLKLAHLDLASGEYAQVIDTESLNKPSIGFVFAEQTGVDTHKVIGIKAKRARGAMARYILTQNIQSIDDLKNFSYERYRYSQALSSKQRLFFINDNN